MVQDRHYSLAREEIIAALTAYTGVTTADGATPVFNTLIDVTLIGKNDFISGKTVLIGSGDALYEDQGAASFDDTTGSITVESPFSAQIKAGTIFRILNAAAGQISELLDSLVSYRGTTTADGAIGGGTLVCSDLTTKPDFDGNQAVIKSGPYAGQVRDIDGVTTGGTVTPHTSFGGTITEGTRFSITAIRTVPAEVAVIAALIGTATDAGDLGTLFSRHKKVIEAVHVHVLLVVGDTAAMDADLDTALQDFLEDKGYDVVVADPPDVAGNLELHYDVIIVSASCVAGDAANLANLRTAPCPVVCHSAAIAVSTVFNMGGTAGTEAAQTQIELMDNTVWWLLEQALGDLTVTASATIYKMQTKTANAITLAETATGTGNNHLTFVILAQGQDDGGTPAYAPDFDRYFIGVADFTNINAAFTSILEEFYDHILHEVRFSPEVVVTPKRVYQEDIPDTDFSLAAIDTALGSDPPAADAANSIVDIDQKQNKTFVLRSLWVNITNWGTGAQMTFQLWVLINGVVTSVDSVVVNVLGIQNLMDLFGLPEIHADGIWVTVIVDVGNTGACSGTFRYAEAKK